MCSSRGWARPAPRSATPEWGSPRRSCRRIVQSLHPGGQLEHRAEAGSVWGWRIVRHLLELHGGSVHAESPGPGEGATFVVTLPLMTERREPAPGPEVRPTDAPEPEEAAAASIRLADVRILVVDDDSGTRDALTEMLAQTGATVRTAESAEEGMRVFHQTSVPASCSATSPCRWRTGTPSSAKSGRSTPRGGATRRPWR